ncbi:hypothetical protein CSB95_3400 [Pseudomonas aeruginosa]|nr:hypothetical protein CSC29_2382 [Pseudomonas aeruginosa]PRW09298.1 hypothetical protein CSB95_3400 [Pseudomonas aeruginosa]
MHSFCNLLYLNEQNGSPAQAKARLAQWLQPDTAEDQFGLLRIK